MAIIGYLWNTNTNLISEQDNLNQKNNSLKKWIKVNGIDFLDEKEQATLKRYLTELEFLNDSLLFSNPRQTQSSGKIKQASDNIGNSDNVAQGIGPINGNASYLEASFQLIDSSYNAKKSLMFERLTNKIIATAKKHINKKTRYADLNKIFNLPEDLNSKIVLL